MCCKNFRNDDIEALLQSLEAKNLKLEQKLHVAHQENLRLQKEVEYLEESLANYCEDCCNPVL